MTYDGSTWKVLSWNCKVGRDHGQVLGAIGDMISNLDPVVICLQEAKQYVGDIRDRFSDDWWIYAHNDWSEANDNPVMVTKREPDHDQKHRGNKDGWDTLRTQTDWTGPHGNVHHGRTWTWVKVDGLWVMSLHRVTAGDGKNSKAFKESHDKLVKWMGNHSPCLVIGDHNCGPKVEYPNASKLVAQHADGTVSHPGGGIDYALQHGVKGTVTEKGKHGSDHPAILWKLDS